MAFGNRNRDTNRIRYTDMEEIQSEIVLEAKITKGAPKLKGKKPITINNTTFFIDKDENEAVAIKRLTKTFTNSIL